ncbi:hypothetical protein E5288_WYG012555 [Bos mutus]|uniref:Uncharacterized protein n=1 Tax=Bos mutus TaxID=72004 RepID=A0A6B0SAZ1_9CETA|nr:hypothetical protein [Bos mutus]
MRRVATRTERPMTRKRRARKGRGLGAQGGARSDGSGPGCWCPCAGGGARCLATVRGHPRGRGGRAPGNAGFGSVFPLTLTLLLSPSAVLSRGQGLGPHDPLHAVTGEL